MQGTCGSWSYPSRADSRPILGVLFCGCWPCALDVSLILWVLVPSCSFDPILWILVLSYRWWSYPVDAGPILWVQAMVPLPQEPLHPLDRALNPHPRSENSTVFPVGAVPILHVLATSCESLFSPMGAGPVLWVLALSHGHWFHPMGAALPQGHWGSYQGTGS